MWLTNQWTNQLTNQLSSQLTNQLTLVELQSSWVEQIWRVRIKLLVWSPKIYITGTNIRPPSILFYGRAVEFVGPHFCPRKHSKFLRSGFLGGLLTVVVLTTVTSQNFKKFPFLNSTALPWKYSILDGTKLDVLRVFNLSFASSSLFFKIELYQCSTNALPQMTSC